MASSTVIVDKDASCANDPDFAVICAFLEKFSEQLQVNFPHFKQLQEWLSNTDEVPNGLRDLHIKLMRKTRRTVHECAWESALSKFCFCYSSQDGWEIERFGYKKSSLKVKLRILRELLENQFDRNNKFRAKLLAMSADSLRSQPIGRDRLGHSYWLTQDPDCNIRVYQEHLDEEIWQVVATNREELVKLISRLKGNEVVLPSDIGFIDEDSSSNSCSVPIEKPPPPEEKDDSQESNHSTSGRVPNIKIKLGNKENGIIATVSNDVEEPATNGSAGEMEEEKKVKPLVISQSKIKLELSKKRSIEDSESMETQEVKKQRPTLLDLNREKKLGRYEKQVVDEEGEEEDQEEEYDEDDVEEEVEDEGEEEEEDENENSVGDGEEDEEDEEEDDEEDGDVDELGAEEDDEDEITDKQHEEVDRRDTKDKRIVENRSELTKNFESNKAKVQVQVSVKAQERTQLQILGKTQTQTQAQGQVQAQIQSQAESQAQDPDNKENVLKDKAVIKDETVLNEESALIDEIVSKDETELKGEEVIMTSCKLKEVSESEKEIIKLQEKSCTEKLQEKNKGQEEDKKTNEENIEPEEKSEKEQEIQKGEAKDSSKFEDIGKITEDKNTREDIDPTKDDLGNVKLETVKVKAAELDEDVEMKEVIRSEEEHMPSDEPEITEPIEDPPVIVKEEGSGAECENGFDIFLCYNQLNDPEPPEFSEEIEASVMFFHGEGSGVECLVGNAKTNQTEEKATYFFGQPGCLKLSPIKNQPKSDESENDCNENASKPKKEENKSPEPINGENHSESELSNKTPKDCVIEKKKSKPESKNGSQDDRRATRRTIVNRKRRLSDDKPEKPATRPSSESETDLNSENLEDPILEEEEEDIGGKRLKMRSKLVNTEIRKKVEAQRKTATKDETTTSSSGGEDEKPRKKPVIKKVEKEPEKVSPPKAKTKQKAKTNPVALKANKVEEKELESTEKEVEKTTKVGPVENIFEEAVNEEISKTSSSTSARFIVKQTKKPHPVESNDESEEEIPKKKQPQMEITSQCPPADVAKAPRVTSPITEVPEIKTEKTQTTEVSVEEEQTTSEKQRKRRSSEEDSKEVAPVSSGVVKSTRSSRRSGPAEPAIELPQVKRTRVKAAAKAEVKTDVKPVEKSEIKIDVGPEVKPEIKSQIPKEDGSKKNTIKPLVKEEDVKNEVKEVIQIKIEPKVKEEPISKPPPVITRPRQQQAAQKQPAVQRRKCHDDVDTKNIIDLESDGAPVRMSRRIAQLKIREEADRRKMEEIALRNMKAELKKKKKAESKPDDPTVSEPSEHSSDQADSEVEVKKKTEKKKKLPGKDGWSSGSEELDEEEVEEHPYEIDHGSPLFKSDHEFSPESDLEDDSQVVPLKRARTAKKEGDEDELETHSPDESCQKCGKSDHPEWILLCDTCNKGYHCSCLSPVIFYIPEGDWFCPPCQQEELIVALENHLKEFDDLVQRKKDEEEEKIRIEEQQRLELEKASQVMEEKKIDKKNAKKQKAVGKKGRAAGGSGKSKRRGSDDDDNSDEEENGSESEGSSNSSNVSSSVSGSSKTKSSSATDTDDEPIYKLRKRRQINVSYRLNEYDEMIKSALKKEEDAVAGAGNLGRGKDISNIYDDTEEKHTEESKFGENGGVGRSVGGKNAGAGESGSDFEPIKRKPKTGRNAKKKHRKLTKLDISSEGDNDSDEDFKTSSMDDDEEDDDEEEDVSQSSDSSLEIYRRRRGSRKGKKKKSRRAARRSARERRKDRNFIVDDSDCDGSEAEVRPRTKKKRKKDSDYTESETNDDDDEELSENIDSEDLCDDSTDSEASDGAWRPSKRKKQRSNAIARKSPKLKPKMSSKAKKTKRYDSDGDSFKASISKNRIIRDDSDEEDSDDSVDSSRKTRGKRCIYMEDYDDESSDGGIKPGVKRPDTPPEEREKFIKKQEEIKRMLAEKNAEGAKLAATPRLIPIKSGATRSPAKPDSLSTVPLAVIRQAKVLDIDYLQRKGESISEGDLDESEFDDDDLPDDFNPEDMDEEAIARMVEEDFAQQQQLKLPLPNEVLRKKPVRESEPIVRPVSTYMPPHATQPPQSSSTSGLQEPVRKKLPMPTLHPPLLRHGYGPTMMQQNRQPHLPLLQNALSAPLNHPMSRQFPPTSQAIPATNQISQHQSAMSAGGGNGDPNKPRGRRKKITPLRDPLQKQQAAAAASAAAAAASKPRPDNVPQEKTESRPQPPPPPPVALQSSTPGVIKSALSIAQPPQLYKPPATNTQPSVITRMPHLQTRPPMIHMGAGPGGGPPFPDQGPRFYRPQHPQPHLRPQAQHQQQSARAPPPQQQPQRPPPPPQHQQQPQQQQRLPPPQHLQQPQRPPPPQQSQSPQHRQPPPTSQPPPPSQPNSLISGNRPPMRHRGPPQMPPMSTHHTMRPSFVGGPPPLRPSSGGGPPPPINIPNNIVRDQGPPRQSPAYTGSEQYSGPPPPPRHSAPPPPPHLSPYRPQMYNNPGFHRGPPVNSSQPSLIRPVGATSEYSTPGSFGGGYGYYPPPLSVPHSAPPPPTASAVPSSVIVSASSLAATTSVVVAPPPSQPVPAAQPPTRPPVSSPSLLEKPCPPAPATAAPLPPSSATIPTSVIELTRKKLTTLETFNTSKNSTPPPLRESSESRSPYSSNPPTIGGPDDAPDDGSGSPPPSTQSTSEFSGLVSYFSSQHDDLNT